MYEELLTWLDANPVQCDHPNFNGVTGMLYTAHKVDSNSTFEALSVADTIPITGNELIAKLANIPVFDAHELDSTHSDNGVWLMVSRARIKVASRSLRAMATTIIPCRDGCLITYIGGINPNINPIEYPEAYAANTDFVIDRAIVSVGDDQYIMVPDGERYFVFLRGDVARIEAGFEIIRNNIELYAKQTGRDYDTNEVPTDAV